MQFKTKFKEKSFDLSFSDDFSHAEVNGISADIEWSVQTSGRCLLRIGNKLHRIDDSRKEDGYISFRINGEWVRVEVKNEQNLLLERLGFNTGQVISAGKIDAPMPGKILEILVDKEEDVEAGQPVVILEAMKMENEIKSAGSGTVSEIFVETGDSVEKNQPLIEIKPRG